MGEMADSVDVQVREDKIHGTKALIRVKASEGVNAEALKKRISEILARYTVRYEIVVE